MGSRRGVGGETSGGVRRERAAERGVGRCEDGDGKQKCGLGKEGAGDDTKHEHTCKHMHKNAQTQTHTHKTKVLSKPYTNNHSHKCVTV